MKIEQLLTFSDLSDELRQDIRDLFKLCDKLEELVLKENDLLMADGHEVDTQSVYLKINLLGQFEEQAPLLFERIKDEASTNYALHNKLVTRVQTLQEKLRINTGLHLHVMHNSPIYEGGHAAICH